MAGPHRYHVRSPDGRAIFGFDSPEGAETAARDEEEQTALALAAARGRDEIAELLREAGAAD